MSLHEKLKEAKALSDLLAEVSRVFTPTSTGHMTIWANDKTYHYNIDNAAVHNIREKLRAWEAFEK